MDDIHGTISLVHGSMDEEVPEQRMSLQFIRPHHTVLEIGGNVGRNSMVIASILKSQDNFVTIESDPVSASMLAENRDANGFSFRIERGALSKRPLGQLGWDTLPWDDAVKVASKHGLVPTLVRTFSWTDLCSTYDLVFDTLVLDCEGAFYYILKDEPSILDTITTVLMENDYQSPDHKEYVDTQLKQRGFEVVYSEPLDASIPLFPHTRHAFYEAWQKKCMV